MRSPRLIAAVMGGVMLATASAAPARSEPVTLTIAAVWFVKFAATAILGALITRSVFPPGSNVCKGDAGKLYSVPPANACLDGSMPERVN